MLKINKWFTKKSLPETKKVTQISKGWIRQIDKSNIAIVFVHGFLSNAANCWTNKSGKTWPEILIEDSIFDGSSIYLSEYYTAINSTTYDINQCAKELYSQLTFQPGRTLAPINYDNILFICHSLGGILVRRIIEENRNNFTKNKIGLLLLGSPSIGSEYAETFKAIANLYGNKIANQLKPDGALLKDLDERFRDLLHNAHFPNLVGSEAVEHHGPVKFRYLPIRMPAIVKPSSASRYFGSPTIIPDTDHFTLVKPENSTAAVHQHLIKFFSEFFLPNIKSNTKNTYHNKSTTSKNTIDQASRRSLILFDMYNKDCTEYYLYRKDDEILKNKIEYLSVWITGPSGSGKTSLAKHNININLLNPLQIELAEAFSGENIEDCYSFILQTYANVCDDEKPQKNPSTFNEVVNVISEVAASSPLLPLFIDELSIKPDGKNTRQIVKFIEMLLDAVKRRIGPHVRFLICSITQPNKEILSAKGAEQIEFMTLNQWTDNEIEQLINKLNLLLGNSSFHHEQIKTLISNASGSPRYIKSFFRLFMSSANQNFDENFSYALRKTTEAHF